MAPTEAGREWCRDIQEVDEGWSKDIALIISRVLYSLMISSLSKEFEVAGD